jgi:branched-chain amino acid aminotransferase
VEEIYKGMQDGSVSEAFGAGTAATIAPIATIGFSDRDLSFPEYSENSKFALLRKELNDYKRGRLGDPYHWLMKI